MARYLVQRVDPFSITFYSNLVGLIVSLPFAYFYDDKIVVSANLSPWLLLIGTAIIVHGLANLLWNQHIQHVHASKASILSNLEPFVAMVVGFILLAKPIMMIEFLGGILIVTGVILSTYERRKRISS
ncbi:MAG TPA: DMT family transporter [Pseudogracilibacillus sp.]|nr:DMT family transporter [Pseudogracilibacillus sp.]